MKDRQHSRYFLLLAVRIGLPVLVFGFFLILQLTILNKYGAGYDPVLDLKITPDCIPNGGCAYPGEPVNPLFKNWAFILIFVAPIVAIIEGTLVSVMKSADENVERTNKNTIIKSNFWQTLLILSICTIFSSCIVLAFDQHAPKQTDLFTSIALLIIILFLEAFFFELSVFTYYLVALSIFLFGLLFLVAFSLSWIILIIEFLLLQKFIRDKVILFITGFIAIVLNIYISFSFPFLGKQAYQYLQDVILTIPALIITAIITGCLAGIILIWGLQGKKRLLANEQLSNSEIPQ